MGKKTILTTQAEILKGRLERKMATSEQAEVDQDELADPLNAAAVALERNNNVDSTTFDQIEKRLVRQRPKSHSKTAASKCNGIV